MAITFVIRPTYSGAVSANGDNAISISRGGYGVKGVWALESYCTDAGKVNVEELRSSGIVRYFQVIGAR